MLADEAEGTGNDDVETGSSAASRFKNCNGGKFEFCFGAFLFYNLDFSFLDADFELS